MAKQRACTYKEDEKTKAVMAQRDDIMNNLYKLSSTLEVVGTIGFEGKKSVATKKVVKDGKTIEESLVSIPSLVGVIVKNISNVEVTYKVCKYTWEDDIMTYIGKDTDKTLKPGETDVISKRDFVRILSDPRFSFRASNVIVRGSSATAKILNTQNIDTSKLLDSYSIAYTDFSKRVWDYTFILKKDPANETEEHMETFAYLYNDKYIKKLLKATIEDIDKLAVSAFKLNTILGQNE